MYRRHPFQQPRPQQQAPSIMDSIASAVAQMFSVGGIFDQAWRDHRKWLRDEKRTRKHSAWLGQHGERECARRRRQGAHRQQMLSHKPGTVWPAHLGARS